MSRNKFKSIDEQGGIAAKLDQETDKHNGRGAAEFAQLYEDYKARRITLAAFGRLMGVSDETLRTSWIPHWENAKAAAPSKVVGETPEL